MHADFKINIRDKGGRGGQENAQHECSHNSREPAVISANKVKPEKINTAGDIWYDPVSRGAEKNRVNEF